MRANSTIDKILAHTFYPAGFLQEGPKNKLLFLFLLIIIIIIIINNNKRDKLYLSAILSGNSERQHAVFQWVFHHRHGLNTKNNSSNNSDDNNNINNYRQCPYDATVTEDTKEFIFFACVRFPLDFQCIVGVVLIIIILIIIIIIIIIPITILIIIPIIIIK